MLFNSTIFLFGFLPVTLIVFFMTYVATANPAAQKLGDTATQADITEMRRCLRGGEQASSSEEFERWDIALHHSFALATHNAVLIGVSQLLIASRRQPIWGGLKKRTFSPELHLEYCAEHDHIVEAIADRDPDGARQAMRAHLRHVRRTLLGDND